MGRSKFEYDEIYAYRISRSILTYKVTVVYHKIIEMSIRENKNKAKYKEYT